MGCGASTASVVLPPTVDGTKVVCLTPTDRGEAANLIGRAFAGTPFADPELVCNWVLGPELADLCEVRQRASVLEYMVGGPLHAQTGAQVLGVRAARGVLQAVSVCWWSPGGPRGTGLDVAGSLGYRRAHATPEALRHNPSIRQRMRALEALRKKMHRQHAPGPHWCVHVVAVDPRCQGQGLSSALIRAVSYSADLQRVPCYLECAGEHARAIFMRFGFEEVGRYTVSAGGYQDSSVPFHDFYAMLRPAAKD